MTKILAHFELRTCEAFFGVSEKHEALLFIRNRLQVPQRPHNEVGCVFTRKRLARGNPKTPQHRRHMSDSNRGEPIALVIDRIELVLHEVFHSVLLFHRKSHGLIQVTVSKKKKKENLLKINPEPPSIRRVPSKFARFVKTTCFVKASKFN